MAIQLSNEQPQFEPQSSDLGANIHAETGEMLSKAFDQLGKAGIKGGELLSNNTLLSQMNTYQAGVDSAKLSVATDPSISNIEKQQAIVDNMSKVTRETPLLGKDKAILTNALEKTQSTFDLAAAKAKFKMGNKAQSLDFKLEYPDTLKQIHSYAAQGDLKTAQDLAQKLNVRVIGLTATGAVPPSLQLRIQKEVNDTLTRGNQLFSAGPSLAKDPVKAAFDQGYGFGDQDSNDYRQKMSTQFQYDSAIDGQNLVQAKQEAMQGILPTGYLADTQHVNDAKYQHMLGYYQGASYAKAHVSTGLSYDVQQKELENLNSNKMLLTPQEEGIRDHLAWTNQQIKNDYYGYYTNQTNAGRNALDEYNSQAVTIKDSNLSPAVKQQQMALADQQFRLGIITYGQTMKIPPEYIRPFAQDDPSVMAIQTGFSPGQDVTAALQVLRNKTPATPYLSNSLASPTQQESAHLVSLAPEDDGAELVMLANQNLQKGTSIDARDSKGKIISNNELISTLTGQPNVNKYLNFVSALPNGATRISSINKTLLNSMKSCMANNSNNDQNACAKYVNTKIMPSFDSYLTDSVEGASYSFLKNELHMPISDSDAKAIASYAAEKGYESIKNLTGIKENSIQENGKLEAQKMVNPLQISNTPDGLIVAFNKQTGDIAYKSILTPSLVTAARMAYADKQTKLDTQRAKLMNIQGLDGNFSFRDKSWKAFGLTEKIHEYHDKLLALEDK